MIRVAEKILIGNSEDEKWVDRDPSIKCVLVVAHDMHPTGGWREKVEYMKVGLVDGPGNLLSTYHAAVLALASLVKRLKDESVLVCCHNGGRSLAVVMMYLYMMNEAPSWDECLARFKAALESASKKVPAIHPIHRQAFFQMDWGMLTRVLNGEVS